MSKRSLYVLVVLSIAACDSPSSSEPPEPPPPITAAALLAHLEVLAADSFFGREAGSEYELEAAEYIRARMQEYLLEPGAPDYEQTFTFGGTLESRNVLAVLPGKGRLAAEWVIVGAHYDAQGFDQVTPDSVVVRNGADDNASGTAMVLELARYLSFWFAGVGAHDEERRSIMFQAYGAEEVGLIGSTYFCQHPTVSMESITAMINLDMVGRLSDDRLVLVGSASSSDWAEVVTGAAVPGLEFAYNETLLNRSDQFCFYQRQRPVLFLHTGLHPDYHQPTDDVGLLNLYGMETVSEFALGVLMDLVDRADPLPFTGFVE
jgi:L-amino acid N-acyltransferase YncA